MFKKISATIILTVLFFSCDIKRPNIILIIADDMSTLENAQTPRIDEIASKGINLPTHILSMLTVHHQDRAFSQV